MKKYLVAGAIVVGALGIWLVIGGRGRDGSDSRVAPQEPDRGGALSEPVGGGAIVPGKADRGDEPDSREMRGRLAAMKKRWSGLADEYAGEDLLQRQREVAMMAVDELGGSRVMLDFLKFLEMEGAGDLRDWVIDKGMLAAFSGKDAEAARKWVLEVEDEKLQERLVYLAGLGWSGSGFEEYLESSTNIHIQSSMLTGYCVGIAGSDPGGAVQAFMDMRPKGVDFTGIARVMAALPPGTDFLTVAGSLPGDEKSLAKSARASLLGAWAYDKPAEAAQYVLANMKKVHAEQLGVVIKQWVEESPEAAKDAAAWVEHLSPGAHRDAAMKAQAEYFAKDQTLLAWEYASQVEDLDRRIEAATVVFKVWEGRDQDAAVAAWRNLFPPVVEGEE